MAANQELIDKFFDAYNKRDIHGIKQVMSEQVTWSFLGYHLLAGVKKGVYEVIAFFDTMNGIMNKSKPTVEKLIVCANDQYIVECQHIKNPSRRRHQPRPSRMRTLDI